MSKYKPTKACFKLVTFHHLVDENPSIEPNEMQRVSISEQQLLHLVIKITRHSQTKKRSIILYNQAFIV